MCTHRFVHRMEECTCKQSYLLGLYPQVTPQVFARRNGKQSFTELSVLCGEEVFGKCNGCVFLAGVPR